MPTVNINFDRDRYAPGDTMTCTVTGDPPIDSVLSVTVSGVVAGTVREASYPVPAWRIAVADADTGWREATRQGTTVVYQADAVRSGALSARLDWLGGSATESAAYTVTAPATLKLGLTYPTTTGETQAQVTARLFSEFPQTGMYRVFRSAGQAPPAWDSALMRAIPAHVDLVVSSKDWNLPAWFEWFASMPQERINAGAQIFWCYQHEFDQWKSVSDTNGRPDPATWRARMRETIDKATNQPWRVRVKLGACGMEYQLRTRPEWHDLWGLTAPDPVLQDLDWFGIDSYNLAPKPYRTGEAMFGQALQVAADAGVPLLVAEWGQARRPDAPDDDDDGTVCAQVMAEHVAYLRTQTIAPVAGVCWYYNHDNVLSLPSGVTRAPEYEALQALIAGG